VDNDDDTTAGFFRFSREVDDGRNLVDDDDSGEDGALTVDAGDGIVDCVWLLLLLLLLLLFLL
jgi:hypothetical protein